jgi:NDP-sugar pyrophosphorylase family protein
VRPGAFVSTWEEAVAGWIGQQAELLLLVQVGTYTDLDFAELVRFHLERGALVTEAYGRDGPLGVAVVSRGAMQGDGSYRNALSRFVEHEQRFSYSGYVNRLRTPADFMQLVEDGLHRRSQLQPAGTEMAQGIWFGDGANVDPTCVIQGPAFVGSGTRLSSCCTVKPGSAIESGCDIDSGTTVDESWILPEIYVGVGLNVRRSIVSNGKMFHLDRQTEVTIIDRRLIGAARSFPRFGFEKES